MLRPSRLHTLSALCLLLAMLIAMPPPARAATFTAGTAAELIAAITAANGTPEADVITLTGNITLTTPDNNTNGPNGLPVITDDITIEGANRVIARSGAAAFRLFNVAAGGTLTLDQVVVRGGLVNTGFDSGGGIYSTGTLTLIDSVVENSRVESTFPNGGGIYSTGTLTVVDSVIRNNVANDGDPADPFDSGGGIYSTGTLTLLNSTVQGNQSGETGGGILSRGVTVIENSLLTGNTAVETGGGLVSVGGAGTSLRINNSTFSNNTADVAGGALLNGSDDVQIFGSTFSSNTVIGAVGANGGAISNQGGTILITASRFTGNRALTTAIGGAIANISLGDITMVGSIVENNTSAAEGGGLYTALATFTVRDSVIRGNSAVNGGGLYQGASNVTGFTVVRTTISGNVATGGLGGGFLGVSTLSSSTFINSTFTGNSAATFGGAIALNGGGQVDLLHSTIVNNSSTVFGNSVGGVNAFAGTMSVGSSIIADNPNQDCNATNASTSLGFNITTGPAGGIPPDRWCSFIPLQPSDQTSTAPLLNALGNNGNLGQTYTLQPGSPAIDAVTAACPAQLDGVDQRGVPRVGGTCDVGAVSDDAVVLPLVYFEAASSVVDNEATAGAHTVNLIIDNTAGTLPAPGTLPLTVYVTATGTAAATQDHTLGATPLIFTFNAGSWVPPGTSQTIPIPITVLDDLRVEGSETIQLALSVAGPGSALAARIQHRVTIIDDDAPPPAAQTVAQAESGAGGLDIFDPAISKLGFLLPGQTGVTVSNPSTVTGQNVVVTDTINSSLRIDRVTTSKGSAGFSGQAVTISIGTLAPGEVVQISIFTTVLNGQSVSNTACVNASNSAGEECVSAVPVSALPATGEGSVRRGWWALVSMGVVGLYLLVMRRMMTHYTKI